MTQFGGDVSKPDKINLGLPGVTGIFPTNGDPTKRGVVKGNGDFSNIETTPLGLFVGDGSSETIDDFFEASGNGTSQVSGTRTVNSADHIRKYAELSSGDGIDNPDGDLNRYTNPSGALVTSTSGLELLRDGRYIQSDGTIIHFPSGTARSVYQIISGSGDRAAKLNHELGQTYTFKVGGSNSTIELPKRT